jgi:cyclic 2,3-diphosphoglycerate synthetase
VTGYLNAYRILLADLVLVTMADESTPHEALAEAIREVKPDANVIAVGFRPRPLAPLEGKRVAYFTTAAPSAHERLASDLTAYGAEVVHVSGNLADRPALQRELETVDADVYLTEIKAAGIDVVAEAGVKRGVEIVLAANDLLPCPGQPDLDPALRTLAEAARAEPVGT